MDNAKLIVEALGRRAKQFDYSLGRKKLRGWANHPMPSAEANALVQRHCRRFHDADIRLLTGASNMYEPPMQLTSQLIHVLALPHLTTPEIAEFCQISLYSEPDIELLDSFLATLENQGQDLPPALPAPPDKLRKRLRECLQPGSCQLVRQALQSIWDLEEFMIFFASPYALEAQFVNPVRAKHAKSVKIIVLDVSPDIEDNRDRRVDLAVEIRHTNGFRMWWD